MVKYETESYEEKFMNEEKKFLTILLIMVMVVCFIGCGKKEPQITGKWTSLDESDLTSLELYSDGTGIFNNYDEDGSLSSYGCTWIAEDGRLKISIDFGLLGTSSTSFDYELTQDTLSLHYEEYSYLFSRQ